MSDNQFHDHLDVCPHCKAHPFDLCPIGAIALFAEANKHQPPLPAKPLQGPKT